MNWVVKHPCPGCGQEVSIDISKPGRVPCPTCGAEFDTDESAAQAKDAERQLADFKRRISKTIKIKL